MGGVSPAAPVMPVRREPIARGGCWLRFRFTFLPWIQRTGENYFGDVCVWGSGGQGAVLLVGTAGIPCLGVPAVCLALCSADSVLTPGVEQSPVVGQQHPWAPLMLMTQHAAMQKHYQTAFSSSEEQKTF